MSLAPRSSLLLGVALAIGGLGATVPAAAAPPVAPAAVAPAAESAAPPAAATPAAASAAPTATSRLEAVLQARAGGLRADVVAARAERESPALSARRQAVAAARAKVDQALVGFAPRVQVQARYLRASSIAPPDLGAMLGLPIAVTFPVVLDMYSVQGSLVVPLSDYVLRLTQNHAAASRSVAAARFTAAAARRQVQRDARVAFYNWARARGGVVVAEQALATAGEHEKDVRAALAVGTASRADQLRVESQVAQTELLVERSRNLAALATEQLRVLMHDPAGTTYELGEDLSGAPAPAAAARLAELYEEALAQRLELRALGETAAAIRETRKVARAGYFPRLDAFANVYEQNPNPRYFPQQDTWHLTWDVGVQLSWTINDTVTTGARVREVEARALETEAQRAGVRDGIRMEVTLAYNALRETTVALRTTRRQHQAAAESQRVRRDLFRVGRATSAELTDAETDVVRASLDLLNARIDARIARLNLDYALGREPRPAPAPTARRAARVAVR